MTIEASHKTIAALRRRAGLSRRAASAPPWLQEMDPDAPAHDFEKHAPAWTHPYLQKHHLPSDPDLHAAKMLRNKEMQAVVLDMMDRQLKGESGFSQMYRDALDFVGHLVHYRMDLDRSGTKPPQGVTDAMRHVHALWSALNQAAQFVGHLKREGLGYLMPWMRKGLKALGWGDHGERAKKASLNFTPPEWLAKIPPEAPLAEYEKHAPAWEKVYQHRHLSEDPEMQGERMLRDKNMQPIVIELVDRQLRGDLTEATANKMLEDAYEFSSDLNRQRIKIKYDEKGKPGEGLSRAGWRAYAVWSALNKAIQFTELLRDLGMDHLPPWLRKGLKALGWGDRGEKVEKTKKAEVVAREFPSEQAKRQYLHDHPQADPAKHSVSPHDSDKRDRIEDVGKGHSAERIHDNHAPKSIKKFVDAKLPAVTHQNKDRILENKAVQGVVSEAAKMPDAELKAAHAEADKYMASLRKRVTDIEKAGGDKDPGLSKALTHAHAVWYALTEASRLKKMKPEEQPRWMKTASDPLAELSALAAPITSKFEEGKPADPTKHMDEEDAEEWDHQNEEHKDEFKAASRRANAADGDHPNPGGWGLVVRIDTNPQGRPTGRVGYFLYNPQGGGGGSTNAGTSVASTIKQAVYHSHLRGTSTPLVISVRQWDPAASDWASVKSWKTSAAALTDDKGRPIAAKFEEGKPADPTDDMSEEDAKKWDEMHDKYEDKFKKGGDDPTLGGFSEGQSADPTENMSEEDAKKWREMNDKYEDKFKKEAEFRAFADEVLAAAGPSVSEGGVSLAPLQKLSDALRSGAGRYKELHGPVMEVATKLKSSADPGDKALVAIAAKGLDALLEAVHAADKLDRAISHPQHRFISAKGGEPVDPMDALERMSRFHKGKPADPTRHMSDEDAAKWDKMNDKYKDKFKTAAAPPQGLYGYTKAIQLDCEAAARKLERAAARIGRVAFQADPRVARFFEVRAARRGCEASRILSEALRGMGVGRVPQKAAAAQSLYGLQERTVRAGLRACAALEAEAGKIASDLLGRRAETRDRIVGFFRDHSRRGRCVRSRLLVASVPEDAS